MEVLGIVFWKVVFCVLAGLAAGYSLFRGIAVGFLWDLVGRELDTRAIVAQFAAAAYWMLVAFYFTFVVVFL
jgi:hypothetical protein